MLFKRIAPDTRLTDLVECYWIIQDADSAPREQKVIPDGFTEVILHTGAPYKIKLNDTWKVQEKNLLAGQIDRHFMLKNTGVSSMTGIKFRPTGLTHLFDLSMDKLTNQVVNVSDLSIGSLNELISKASDTKDDELRIKLINKNLLTLKDLKEIPLTPTDRAVDHVLKNHGMVTLAELSNIADVGERQLENLFKKWVGISPKRFAQIIRFNYIFHLVENHEGWSEIAYEAAYYDQSHFIKNFRNFTGENPADYAFDEKNMANFFLKKA